MARAYTAARPTSALIVRATLLAGWIGVCDLWLKVIARAGGCTDAPGMGAALRRPWRVPEACGGIPLLGDGLRLLPAARDGGPFGMLAPALGGAAGMAWGLGLIALATAVTFAVLRWRWRDPGDALALGALWGAAATLALPRVLRDGTGLTEFSWTSTGMTMGVGDLALVWSLVWLSWRAIAEARA